MDSQLLPIQGVVVKKNINSYAVRTSQGVLSCAPGTGSRQAAGTAQRRSARQAERAREHEEQISVGDQVVLQVNGDGSASIVELLPRRNWLARRGPTPMPGAHAFQQVIAANVDQAAPVFAAANPAPKWNMLDRYLAAAGAAGLPAIIVLTKIDLVEDPEDELFEIVAEYRRIGYRVLLTSAQSGKGIEELNAVLSGQTTVLLGKSGVGKTSLLNALQPGLGLRVKEVSQATGKGRHTTTHQEMFALENGGALIDTPGVREFGLWDIPSEDLARYFPEIAVHLGKCRFGMSCRHDEEPGCAVRQAVMAGEISPQRYQSLLRLQVDP